MFKFLVIVLDNLSVSYCHYNNNYNEACLIDIETLKGGIEFAMKHNLAIHYLFPKTKLPQEYIDVINSYPSIKIADVSNIEQADVLVIDELEDFKIIKPKLSNVILRISKQRLFNNIDNVSQLVNSGIRVNLILTDVENFKDTDIAKYEECLNVLIGRCPSIKSVDLNVLTDRLKLSEMNNCNAGVESIALAPNEKFYVCPDFYYSDASNSVGSLKEGINIPNANLFQFNYAAICKHCDAYHCKRCVWLNKKMTLEVNVPSREQCVIAHVERNASRCILHKNKDAFPNFEIKEIDYLDPFDNKDNWNE